jgi:hypothetical protein
VVGLDEISWGGDMKDGERLGHKVVCRVVDERVLPLQWASRLHRKRKAGDVFPLPFVVPILAGQLLSLTSRQNKSSRRGITLECKVEAGSVVGQDLLESPGAHEAELFTKIVLRD